MAKFQNPEQVADTRKTSIEFNFNMVAVKAALKATPLKAPRQSSCGGGKEGAFTITLKQCINAAKEDGTLLVSMAQIQAMMMATLENPITDTDERKKFNKRISDQVWGMSDKNKKNTAPLLKGVANGTYEIL